MESGRRYFNFDAEEQSSNKDRIDSCGAEHMPPVALPRLLLADICCFLWLGRDAMINIGMEIEAHGGGQPGELPRFQQGGSC
jgi:hypothetical protein